MFINMERDRGIVRQAERVRESTRGRGGDKEVETLGDSILF